MPEIKRLLVANRGEIAVRVIRAAQEMGIVAIAAYSDADEASLAVRIADEAVNIGGAHAKKSYLNAAALLEAATSTGADAVHPGYGFLSENAEFARAVTDAGLVWIGPDAGTIERMGHKAQAIATARAAGVPVVPGSDGLLTSADEAVAVAGEIGYPVLLKAAAGGGGRGIRIASTDEEVAQAFTDARQEAEAAFGDGWIYLEKFITRARHIEVQVLGDGTDAVHFFERDCSLQRRRQKVWEEAPAAILDGVTRGALCESAVALTRSVGYVGAGTIEYLYDPDTRAFYFIEMNTRIQVEHPITEEICSVDLIRAMIEVCQGDPLPYRQDDIVRRGHAIEVRINAEDPAQGFRPAPGTVETVSWAQGPGVRVDSMAYSGYRIPPFYDSLIGKLIVWAETREQALARLGRALRETEIAAPATTLPFFEELLAEDDVRRNALHTTWIEQRTEKQ
ncbi:acetyl-CoA carboxylase biotin carboxylase subunit [Tsukamurella ocularis]|uniref:acetyl-CoA carboxylase biotin carboxylase subunit n=1 Tax=Tsukamurella ocularis TaxID=1970234 RepID=UPI0021699FC3|nr:acetyl-CoA carboxylase biotin carboxylase subunit [Tsukamurella ocularis]MCS3781069.1 acetyl-CoA carboxylase biotin carboxylase subunit [Tsukamurella ocularis]MCS3786893.1 acetyl-CoA carboxylase biotin carboxylase subunit [Tsukamurella ocularis]MCS3850735.1 acetyl-CoA carboxylase biotin carboxylase subunit [Tsukamurella ocularis]